MLELGASENDAATIGEATAQVPGLKVRVRAAELGRMLSGPVDHAGAIVSIHPGTGGNDAKDWAQMLMRMYLRWCERRGYKTEIIDYQEGDEAGIDGASFSVQGDHAFGYLRSENGVHRLVRISPFDANARRHTAFAAVEVTPDIEDEIDIQVKDEDLDITTMRAGGKGGQNVERIKRLHKPRARLRLHGPTKFVATSFSPTEWSRTCEARIKKATWTQCWTARWMTSSRRTFWPPQAGPSGKVALRRRPKPRIVSYRRQHV